MWLGVATAMVFLVPAPAEAAFAPTDLSGLTLWLHADDRTTLTNSTGASVGLGDITSGTKVGQWFDASGNGYTAKQLVTTLQPTFYTGGALNGQSYLSFTTANTSVNAKGGVLRVESPFLQRLASSGSYTITWVVQRPPSAIFQILSTNKGSGNARWFYLAYQEHFERFNAGSTAEFSAGTGHVLTYTFQQTSGLTGTETFYIDGEQVFQIANTLPNDAAAPYYIGGASNGDNPFANSDPTASQFYEHVVYRRVLPDVERAQLETYLGDKYGVTVDATVGPLTVGTISVSSVTRTSQTIGATPTIGGSGSYTYQWYRSTTSGSLGTALTDGGGRTGSTSSTLNDAGLTAQTNYYYTLAVTDPNTTAYSAQLHAPTHGNTTIKIGFLGDSISSQDLGAGSPPQQFQANFFRDYPETDPQILNQSQGGRKAHDLSTINGGGGEITSIVSTLQAFGAQWVLLMLGTNDAAQQVSGTSGYTSTRFQSDYQNIIAHLTGAGLKVINNDLMWRSGSSNQAVVQDYNARIASLDNGTTVRTGSVSDYSYFASHQSQLPDGLHPNSEGTTNLARLWSEAAGPIIFASVTSTTVLASDTNPSTVSGSITLTATVTPNTATGTITFREGSTTLGTTTLGHGSGVLTVSDLSPGVHALTAVYSGNSDYIGSTSNTIMQTVNRVASTTVLVSDANPAVVGELITLTAFVTPSSATGTVSVSNGASNLGTITLGHGSGSLSTTSLPAGSHPLVAVYGGNTLILASTGITLTQVVTAASNSFVENRSSSSSSVRQTSGGGRGHGRMGSPGLTPARGNPSSVVTGPSGNFGTGLSSGAVQLLLNVRDRLADRIERRIQETPSIAAMLWRILERLDARIAARLR